MSGARADEVIADDVEVPNNSYTQPMRDKLSEAVKEFEAILKPKENYLSWYTTSRKLCVPNPRRKEDMKQEYGLLDIQN